MRASSGGAFDEPTAVQAVAAVQETALSMMGLATPGSGVFCTDQVVPSQPSARVAAAPLTYPTAMHEVLDVQATPLKVVDRPASVGVAWIVQVVPLSPSARAVAGDVAFDPPTATHTVTDWQETPAR